MWWVASVSRRSSLDNFFNVVKNTIFDNVSIPTAKAGGILGEYLMKRLFRKPKPISRDNQWYAVTLELANNTTHWPLAGARLLEPPNQQARHSACFIMQRGIAWKQQQPKNPN